MYDQTIILDPLKEIGSLSDYLRALQSGKIHDLQPLRDLSLWIDLQVDQLLGISKTTLLTNLALLIFCTHLTKQIFSFYFSAKTSIFLSLVFLSHPSIQTVFVEPSQRKHILSFLFFLLLYQLFQKTLFENCKVKAIFYYLFLALSHPINALCPLFFWMQEKSKYDLKVIQKHLSFLALGALIIAANTYYYSHFSPASLIVKITEHNPAKILLGITLFFRQTFFPFYYSDFYAINDIVNYIFIILMLIFHIFAYINNRPFFLKSILMMGLVFFTLYAPKTNVLNQIYQNAYILTPLFIYLLLAGEFLKKLSHQKIMALGLMLVFVFSAITLRNMSHRTSILDLQGFYFKNEKTCTMSQMLSINYLTSENIEEFSKVGLFWLNNRCLLTGQSQSSHQFLISTFLIIHSDEFNEKEKNEMFEWKMLIPEDLFFTKLALRIKNQGIEAIKSFDFELLKTSDLPSAILFQSYLIGKLHTYCKDKSSENCKIFEDYYDRSRKGKILLKYRKQKAPTTK